MKNTVKTVALLSVLALGVAACGSKPTESASGGGESGNSTSAATQSSESQTSGGESSGETSSSGEQGSKGQQKGHKKFDACMVTDSGGVNDRSFNQTSWEGVKEAVKAYGISKSLLESKSNADYVPNVQQFVQQKCNIIITVGFLLADATKAAAKKNPNQKFAIVDNIYKKAPDNLKSLVFNTAQAAFMGGYVAAGMTKTGKVATFGGVQIPTVTIYMDGFAEGINYYNKKHDTDVQLLGWSEKSQKGSFTGDFTDQSKGKTLTQNFIRQGADIIFPVAGPVGLGAAAAAKEAGDVNLIWVDTDGCISAKEYCGLFITSVMKAMDVAVKTAIHSALTNTFSGKPYIGTLQNGGVQIAPFHQFSDDVPADLKKEVKNIKKKIIAGKIKITSPAQPGS